MAPLQIIVLIENESGCETLYCEHGLSLYLRYGDYNILLDAGQSGAFAKNAAALNCPLTELHAAVLSHGHYDHADGFPSLFEQNETIKVHARPTVMEPQYAADARYIGLDPTLLQNFSHRFDLSNEQREILPGLWLIPDAVDHEQSLVAETEHGLVVMNSCCHAGADHIIANILEHFPDQKVHALIGGLHLMGPQGVTSIGKTPDEVYTLALRLTGELGVEHIYTGHCTGAPAFTLMQESIPHKLHSIHTGDILEF